MGVRQEAGLQLGAQRRCRRRLQRLRFAGGIRHVQRRQAAADEAVARCASPIGAFPAFAL